MWLTTLAPPLPPTMPLKHCPHPPASPPLPRKSMTEDYQQQWEGIANQTDEAEAVRVMAKILDSKEGRVFISRLERKDAEFSIRILDRVSCGLHPPFHSLRRFVRESLNTTSNPQRRTLSLLH